MKLKLLLVSLFICVCPLTSNARWISGGHYGNSIAYSDDGINWVGLGPSIFDIYGNESF